jgi:hypothetical protein
MLNRPVQYLALALGALAACGGSERMKGFPLVEARSLARPPEALDACVLRRGRLVIEVERALVREYPHDAKDALHIKKQPLLLLWMRHPEGGPGSTVLTPFAAPTEYRPGDELRCFAGRVLLDQPLRHVGAQQLELRLAENNRTVEPEWEKYGAILSRAALGAGSAAGLPMPPTDVVTTALDMLRRLDEDDLILLWKIPVDEVVKALDSPRRAARWRLATPRKTSCGPGEGLPAAELDLVAWIEPEAGCP